MEGTKEFNTLLSLSGGNRVSGCGSVSAAGHCDPVLGVEKRGLEWHRSMDNFILKFLPRIFDQFTALILVKVCESGDLLVLHCKSHYSRTNNSWRGGNVMNSPVRHPATILEATSLNRDNLFPIPKCD